MKKFNPLYIWLIAMVFAVTGMASAQTYPISSPVYIPNAALVAQSITATGDFQVFNVQGVAGASIQVAGSPSGLVGAVQATTDGTNYVTLGLEQVGGGALTNSITGTGIWRFSTAGFTKVKFHVTGYTSGATTVRIVASAAPNAIRVISTGQDPCQDPNVAKATASITVSTATTTALVTAVTGKIVYVCGFMVTYTSGTSPVVQFKSGTQATNPCDTSGANLTGAFAIPATAGQGVSMFAGSTMFATPASSQLCLVSTGTTPTFNGFLTYVQ